MLLVCCGMIGILSHDVHLRKLARRNFREKRKIQKWESLVYKTHLRIRGKVEISSAPYYVDGVCKGALHHGKGGEIISDFDSKKSKILSVRFGDFLKFARQRIERSGAPGTASNTGVWFLESPKGEGVTPKFSLQKLKNWLTCPNNDFPNTVFLIMLSVKSRFRKIPSRFLNLFPLRSCYSLCSTLYHSKISSKRTQLFRQHRSSHQSTFPQNLK